MSAIQYSVGKEWWSEDILQRVVVENYIISIVNNKLEILELWKVR